MYSTCEFTIITHKLIKIQLFPISVSNKLQHSFNNTSVRQISKFQIKLKQIIINN